jgi:hypothetical protein
MISLNIKIEDKHNPDYTLTFIQRYSSGSVAIQLTINGKDTNIVIVDLDDLKAAINRLY